MSTQQDVPLFSAPLQSALTNIETNCTGRLQQLSSTELKDDGLVDRLRIEFIVNPVTLRADAKVDQVDEVNVEPHNNTMRMYAPGTLVPGIQVARSVPFDGDPWLFRFHATEHSAVRVFENAIYGHLGDDHIVLTYRFPKENREKVKPLIAGEIERIAKKLQDQRVEIDKFNDRIGKAIDDAVSRRRKDLDDLDDFKNSLGG